MQGGSVLELLSGLIVLLLIAAGVKAFTNRTRLPFSVVLVFLAFFFLLYREDSLMSFRPFMSIKSPQK
jgi:hypothetical protein